MQTTALVIVVAAGVWLIAVALLMALFPSYCLHLFEKMSANLAAYNWRLNLIEQGLRILAGAAFIIHAPASQLPLLFQMAGWMIVVSSLLILILPMKWHGAFGFWWHKRLTPLVLRLLSPLSAAAGVGLIYAAL